MEPASSGRDGPTVVSVIVPCYNVEAYVDDCLRSVASQSFADIQIVCVDDGSTDATPAILSEWASSDERVEVVTQANSGLGSARNAGIDAADGDFLFFLDSDDMLPEDALERMVASAAASGAEIVSGAAEQFTSDSSWRAPEYGVAFDDDVSGTDLDRCPELVLDQKACSKLFRRSFWNTHGFRFPANTLYEDIEIVMRAYALARSIDLISRPTYLWRRRSRADASITQDRYRPGSARDRFTALAAADGFLEDNASRQVWAEHGARICNVDCRLYARLVKGAPDPWTDEFLDAASSTLATIEPTVWGGLTGPMELICRSIRDRDAVGVNACVPFLSGLESRRPTTMATGAVMLAVRRPGRVVSSLRRRFA